MNRAKTIAVLLIIAAVFSVSCRKKASVKGVELAVDFSDKALTDNLMTDVTYRWKTTRDFQKMDQDLSVFVHFWNGTNMLFQDDYMPEPPTSKWEPGKEYTATHRIFIPKFIDEFDPQFKGEGTLRLSVGLYSPFDRTGKVKFQMHEGKLKVLPPPPDTPEIVYENGWYDQETSPTSPLKRWRWTAREARCLIDNPRRDALLIVRGSLNTDAVKDQKVILKINDTVLDEFIPPTGEFDKSYKIAKDMLGSQDDFRLVIATDKPFVPAKVYPTSKDERELGIQVSFIYFR
jgi:hypothetical protein